MQCLGFDGVVIWPNSQLAEGGSPTQVLSRQHAKQQPQPRPRAPCAQPPGVCGGGAGQLWPTHGLCGPQACVFPRRFHLWETHSYQNGADILFKYLNFICRSSRKGPIRFYSKRCFWDELVFSVSGDTALSPPLPSTLQHLLGGFNSPQSWPPANLGWETGRADAARPDGAGKGAWEGGDEGDAKKGNCPGRTEAEIWKNVLSCWSWLYTPGETLADTW